MTARINSTCKTSAVAVLTAIAAPAWGDAAGGILALGQAPGQGIPIGRMFLWPNTLIGMGVIQLLLLMSLTAVALIVRNALRYRRSQVLRLAFAARLKRTLADGDPRDALALARNEPSLLGKLTQAALEESPRGFPTMEAAVAASADAQAASMFRSLEPLNVLGNLGPMLGLFGTVYGMIVAFQELVAAGGRPDPGQLAAGISTSLVTTFWGLVVAIPALAAYALLRSRVESLVAEAVHLTSQLIEPFRPPNVPQDRPALRVAPTTPIVVARSGS
jgi:biopolymer transport protein ExbB